MYTYPYRSHTVGNVCWTDGIQLFVNAVKNHLYLSLRTPVHTEKYTTYTAYCIISYTHEYTYIKTTKRDCSLNIFIYRAVYRTKSFILTHPLLFPLILNSFDKLNDWKSMEDKATGVSGIHLSVKPVCVFSRSVKTKRQFSEYFIPVHYFFPVLHHNSDH